MSKPEIPPPLQRVLDKLKLLDKSVKHTGGLQFQAQCPAHDDDNPSLSIGWGKKQTVVLHCQGNCDRTDVMKALGLTNADLNSPVSVVATYEYTDEDGVSKYRVQRTSDKQFWQSHVDPDNPKKWIWGMAGVERLPYKLAELAEALQCNEDVYIVEGEKDVEAMHLAYEAVATCNSGGAGKWNDDLSQYFVGSQSSVTVVADNDKAGFTHALSIYDSLRDVASIEARIVRAAVGKDAADHIEADHGLDDFEVLTVPEVIALKSGDESDVEDDRAARVESMANDIADREAAQALFRARKAAELAERDKRVRVLPGGAFALDLPETVPALVGSGSEILAMKDEATLFVGGDGVGKSSLVQQLALARIGLRPEFLGFKVEPAEGRVLYLAMDRPGQIRRSLARMVSESDRSVLDERMATWMGPLPIDPLSSPHALSDWIREEFGSDISDVVADSYKDLAPGLAEDKPGGQLNLAMQEVLSRGMQWVGIHHQRKPAADRTHDYNLSDVYGSRWLTAGAGSVFMVLGDAGDTTVELRHVKQPLGVVGPLIVRHDHQRGMSTRVVANTTVSGVLMVNEGERFTVKRLCEELYGEFSDRLRKRVTRELANLSADPDSGIHEEKGGRGGSTGSTPSVWWFEQEREPVKLSATKGRTQRSRASA